MIKTQLIKVSKKPFAVILDYSEYKRLIAFELEKEDYDSAVSVKLSNEKWLSHQELRVELGIG